MEVALIQVLMMGPNRKLMVLIQPKLTKSMHLLGRNGVELQTSFLGATEGVLRAAVKAPSHTVTLPFFPRGHLLVVRVKENPHQRSGTHATSQAK
jgi:hypothetical protein